MADGSVQITYAGKFVRRYRKKRIVAAVNTSPVLKAIKITKSRSKTPRTQNVKDHEDRVITRSWASDTTLSRLAARLRATTSSKTARKFGLSKKRSRPFFDKWYDYNPKIDRKNNHPVYTSHAGQNGCQKFSHEFKMNHIQTFVNLNNVTLVTCREYCRQNKLVHTTLSRWIKNYTSIRPYQLRRVKLSACILTHTYILYLYMHRYRQSSSVCTKK